MNLEQAIVDAAMNDEFVENFNRLSGCNFGRSLKKRSPIEFMVDKACGIKGESPEDVRVFIDFFVEYVWLRLPDEAFQN